MSDQRLRVGVIGAGVGALHLAGYTNIPEVEVIALAGLDDDRGQGVHRSERPAAYRDRSAEYPANLENGPWHSIQFGRDGRSKQSALARLPQKWEPVLRQHHAKKHGQGIKAWQWPSRRDQPRTASPR